MDEKPFWTYQDLVLFLGAGLPAIFGATMLAGLIRKLAGGEIAKPLEVLLVQLLAWGLWFGALWALLRFKYRQPFWQSLEWNANGRVVLPWLLRGPLMAMTLVVLSVFLRMPKVDTPMSELLRSQWALLLIGGFASTLGPMFEELGFRGFLMPLLTRTFGATAGIVLSAAAFAVLHGPEYAWSWRHVALVGIAGCAFGWARLKTGSTAAAAAMHATYNMTLFAGLLYQGEYLDT
jgi:hypothetical protein